MATCLTRFGRLSWGYRSAGYILKGIAWQSSGLPVPNLLYSPAHRTTWTAVVYREVHIGVFVLVQENVPLTCWYWPIHCSPQLLFYSLRGRTPGNLALRTRTSGGVSMEMNCSRATRAVRHLVGQKSRWKGQWIIKIQLVCQVYIKEGDHTWNGIGRLGMKYFSRSSMCHSHLCTCCVVSTVSCHHWGLHQFQYIQIFPTWLQDNDKVAGDH